MNILKLFKNPLDELTDEQVLRGVRISCLLFTVGLQKLWFVQVVQQARAATDARYAVSVRYQFTRERKPRR